MREEGGEMREEGGEMREEGGERRNEEYSAGLGEARSQ
jgi:hypothetical protein